ncbi:MULTISPECIES: hypothetical protein [Burkholderia]|uniref:hypothetical protein n=1 Tax=Burkholderia TaxID=32008 RepID=UPI0012E9FC13|nr:MULTISPECIES: hypothetical protein [unclassified Burkholderia]
MNWKFGKIIGISNIMPIGGTPSFALPIHTPRHALQLENIAPQNILIIKNSNPHKP